MLFGTSVPRSCRGLAGSNHGRGASDNVRGLRRLTHDVMSRFAHAHEIITSCVPDTRIRIYLDAA